ncbi:MAG: Holliday junction branch migration DNA helicase RuvB [Deltaproteobacteria bacterium]|nr:Holliday junction branch migration DNA helicase RuvB [Deltaproteobacteria bacterium]
MTTALPSASDDPFDLTPNGGEEAAFEASLRPKRLAEYVGQNAVKEALTIFIEAASRRREALDHALFCGPPGLGKTTLAHIIAAELGVAIHITSGPVLERAGDLAGILTNLEARQVLFIDEIHRLPRIVEELLYPAMEDFRLDLVVGQGPAARTVRIDLPHFTLIGATTRVGLLTSPLRDRFGIVSRLEYYAPEELAQILSRSAELLQTALPPAAALEIALRSRGTPRIANRLLRRARDFAQVRAAGRIDIAVARDALTLLSVDQAGFDPMDRKILLTIIEKFNGGPVGIETIASAVSEARDTIEDVYEPFLIQHGYLARTPRGRVATTRSYEHFGRTAPTHLRQGDLYRAGDA